MQFPVYIIIGKEKILLHIILEFLAFLIAFRYYTHLRKGTTDPISPTNRTWIIIGAIFGALIGSRLIGGLENIPLLRAAPNKLLYFYENKTVVGGFIGGLFGVELMKKMIGEKNSSGDLFVFPMILGLIIGRIGCFSMGIYEETYGNTTDFFTGMDLGDHQMRHPVTLYEIAFLILLWTSLSFTEKIKKSSAGMCFKIFMAAYLIFRFLLDFIKPHYSPAIGLSIIQFTCLLGLVYYFCIFIRNKRVLNYNPPHA